MRLRTLRRGTLLALFLGVFSGCHTYRVVDTPAIGSIVRVQVPVSSALDDPNAAARTAAVEGTVVSAGDTLVLAMQTRREYGAFRELMQMDTVRLGQSQASLIEVQEFSTSKSVALGVVITAGALIAGVVAFNSTSNGGDTPPVDPGEPAPAIVVSSAVVSMILGLFGN